MAVYDRVHIYSSSDLKDWRFESEFGGNRGRTAGSGNVPDLFPLKVDRSWRNIPRWAMIVVSIREDLTKDRQPSTLLGIRRA